MKTLILLFIMTVFNSSFSNDFEGYVKYELNNSCNKNVELIEYLRKQQTAICINYVGLNMKIIYDGVNKKTIELTEIVKGFAGLQESKTANINELIDISKDENINIDSIKSRYKIIKTNTKKVIAGIDCNEFIIVAKRDSIRSDSTIVIMSKQYGLDLDYGNINKLFHSNNSANQNGFIQKTSYAELGVMAMISKYSSIIAKEFVPQKLEDSIFEIPKDYEVITLPIKNRKKK